MLITKARFPVKQMALMGWWPGFLKKAFYRLKGYKIGKKVSIGFGSVIVGENVEIGDHASISFLSFVRGRLIRIGAHVQIGATTFIDTPHFEIGDGSKINEQVFIGGLQFPDSKLVIGRNCQIMQMSFINPTRSITIGDDSGIGGDCLLFGHTSWLSQLEGYKVNFEPIAIGNSVSISWRVFVLPGVRIGDGAVIGANSLVSTAIPPKCLAIGYPARVVSKFPDFPKDLPLAEKSGLFDNMVREMLLFFEGSGLHCEEAGPVTAIFRTDRSGRKKGKGWRLQVDRTASPDKITGLSPGGLDVYLRFLGISAEERKTLDVRTVAWFDVQHKERSDATNELADEVAQFLRRFGIRFLRVRK